MEFVSVKNCLVSRVEKSASCPKANSDRTACKIRIINRVPSRINNRVKRKFLLRANRSICLNQGDIAAYIKRQ